MQNQPDYASVPDLPDDAPDYQSPRAGFDAPESDLAKDLLNRRPLARRIYSVCSNTAPEWSVRIGIYGEWGTGKSSVLRFVETLAIADGHLVSWFNPWEFTTKEELWKAFVLQIYKDLETKIGAPTQAGSKAVAKSRMDKFKRIATSAVGVWNESAAKAVEGALELVKKSFTFSEEARHEISQALGGKRVIVVIDDLDRTAAELVPGILYAIKEILDVPGFTFLCAFDPVIVGNVLSQQNEAFGDGLKFLEKIIDYPIWLPIPTAQGLTNIARASAAEHCSFVPSSEIEQAVELLPQNPRSIKQFVRLLSLLKSEIDRYEPQELKWRVIVSATVLNVQHPRLAPLLLADHSFWDQIQTARLMSDRRKDDTEKLVEDHIAKSASTMGMILTAAESRQIANALIRMTMMIDLWLGVSRTELKASASISDDPISVTWKECFQLISECSPSRDPNTIAAWIQNRVASGSHSSSEILEELVLKLLKLFLINLRNADGGFSKAAQQQAKADAEKIFALLRVMSCQGSSVDGADPMLKWLPLEKLFEDLPPLIGAVGGSHARMWPKIKMMLEDIVGGFPDLARLLDILSIHRSWFRTRQSETKSQEFYLHLANALTRRHSPVVAQQLSQPDFVKETFYSGERFPHVRNLLFRQGEFFWSSQRSNIVRILKSSRRNEVIRINAYEFLYWFEYVSTNAKDDPDASLIPVIAAQAGLLKAFWDAATMIPFAEGYAYRLRQVPELYKALGVDVKTPKWWNEAVASYEKQLEASVQPAE